MVGMGCFFNSSYRAVRRKPCRTHSPIRGGNGFMGSTPRSPHPVPLVEKGFGIWERVGVAGCSEAFVATPSRGYPPPLLRPTAKRGMYRVNALLCRGIHWEIAPALTHVVSTGAGPSPTDVRRSGRRCKGLSGIPTPSRLSAYGDFRAPGA
jgi:hypothetical protein